MYFNVFKCEVTLYAKKLKTLQSRIIFNVGYDFDFSFSRCVGISISRSHIIYTLPHDYFLNQETVLKSKECAERCRYGLRLGHLSVKYDLLFYSNTVAIDMIR